MGENDSQEARSPAVDLSGRQLGDYHLLRRLGRGAMAEVYLAEQRSLGRRVALKVLKSDLAKDETYVQRFQREARAAAALVHANIVQIHEVGCIDGVYFIAQEYVQGQNLQQWLARNGTLDLRLALIVIRQVAAALAKAAEARIVHRDIKPENIMITRAGEVKVADFGLARLLEVGKGVNLTQVGMTMGTPLYMSPEQAEGHVLDHRSDIYSLGVTCYHVLAGRPPFTGDTALSVAVQHLKKRPEPLENLRPDLPPKLARIIHKMMAKSPQARYQSARDLLRELRPLQQEHVGDDWPDDLPGVETEGLDLAGSTLGEATQRLGAVMRNASSARWSRLGWVVWAAAAVAAFLSGGALAHWTVLEKPLLAGVEDRSPTIPKQDSARAHFFLVAMTDGTNEEAWQDLIDFFPAPQDRQWVYAAKQKLAGLYLLREEDEKAMEIFKELVAVDEMEKPLRAFGLAGQYWIYTKRHQYQQASAMLTELWPLRRDLEDRQMRSVLQHAIAENRKRVGEKIARQWEDEFRKYAEEDVEGPNAGEPAGPVDSRGRD